MSYEAMELLAKEQSESQKRQKQILNQLTEFGRERLSPHFFMPDFMYSEISAVNDIANVPECTELAIKAGKGLCENLLEPLRDIFGHISVRSSYRSAAVNRYCNEHGLGCASNAKNFAKHIWDRRDNKGCMGATACIVIPWFIDSDRYKENRDWRPLAWFIHDRRDDTLPYSEMCFYPKNAAFNLTWRECNPRHEIRSHAKPKGILTKPGLDNFEGDHSEYYGGFPGL